jgi:hypothetical protein
MAEVKQPEQPPIRGGLVGPSQSTLTIEYRCCGRVIHEVPTHLLLTLLGRAESARDGHVDHVICPVCKDGWDITVMPRISNHTLEKEQRQR